MKIIETSIPDVKIIEPKVFGDERGFFLETFRDDWFKQHVADVTFIQDNHSKSSQGILRGMHYQLEQTQGKLVRVTAGEVYDVAIDMRKNSPSLVNGLVCYCRRQINVSYGCLLVLHMVFMLLVNQPSLCINAQIIMRLSMKYQLSGMILYWLLTGLYLKILHHHYLQKMKTACCLKTPLAFNVISLLCI